VFNEKKLIIISMPWTILPSLTDGIIVVNLFGIYTPGDTSRLIADLNHVMVRDHLKLILVDCLKVETNFQTTEIFNRPAIYELTGFPRECKTAILVNGLGKDTFFLEDVCNNRGYNVKAFVNKEKAEKWLVG
jgi:hypothetical protein